MGTLLPSTSWLRFTFEFIKWLRKAAEQEEPNAQFELGYAYVSGDGVQKQIDEAVKWFRRSAEHGSPRGQGALGTAYANGDAGVRDLVEAYKWFLLAVAQNDAGAKEGLRNLAQRLSMEQILEAKKQADAFKPNRASTKAH